MKNNFMQLSVENNAEKLEIKTLEKLTKIKCIESFK